MSGKDILGRRLNVSDGKIMCIGIFTAYNGTSAIQICRLNSNGTLDATFIGGTGFTGGRPTHIIEGDGPTAGKYLVSGDFTHYKGVACNNNILIDNVGDIDLSFNSPTLLSMSLGTGIIPGLKVPLFLTIYSDISA